MIGYMIRATRAPSCEASLEAENYEGASERTIRALTIDLGI